MSALSRMTIPAVGEAFRAISRDGMSTPPLVRVEDVDGVPHNVSARPVGDEEGELMHLPYHLYDFVRDET